MRKIFIIFLISLLPLPAYGQFPGFGGGGDIPVIDASNLEQAIIQVAKLIAEIKILKDQYDNMILHSLTGGGGYDDPMTLLNQLRALLTRANGLGYSLSGVDAVFKQRYPGYIPYGDWDAEYKRWSETALDTLSNNLANLNAQSEAFQRETFIAQALIEASHGSPGRMAAIQSGNDIMGELLNHMMKLKQVAMAHSNVYTVVEGYKISKEAQRNKWDYEYWMRGWSDLKPYGSSGTGVSSIPYP